MLGFQVQGFSLFDFRAGKRAGNSDTGATTGHDESEPRVYGDEGSNKESQFYPFVASQAKEDKREHARKDRGEYCIASPVEDEVGQCEEANREGNIWSFGIESYCGDDAEGCRQKDLEVGSQ